MVYSARKLLNLQCAEHGFGFFGGWSRCRRSRSRSQCAQSNVAQCRAQGPTLGQVILNCNVGVPQLQASVAKTANQLLYYGVVDEVVEAQSVRVLEFELVVIRQETEKVEGRCYLASVLAVLDVFHERWE
jgi:hypothetical protein